MTERVVSAIVTERAVCDDVIARAMSPDWVFSSRSATVLPPRDAQPNFADRKYRGELGWHGGKSGKSGKGGKSGKWIVAPGSS